MNKLAQALAVSYICRQAQISEMEKEALNPMPLLKEYGTLLKGVVGSRGAGAGNLLRLFGQDARTLAKAHPWMAAGGGALAASPFMYMGGKQLAKRLLMNSAKKGAGGVMRGVMGTGRLGSWWARQPLGVQGLIGAGGAGAAFGVGHRLGGG